MRRSFVCGLLAAITMPLLMTAPVAADEASVNACARSELRTGLRQQGSVVNKAASSCSDLNVIYVQNLEQSSYEQYAGFYRSSNGVWHIGSRGYVLLHDGPVNWVVLLSDVRTGTPMGVGS